MLHPQIVRPEVTAHILHAFGLGLRKKLGQNFLIDQQVLAGIVDAAAIQPGEAVLEIGPGIGTLTQALAEAGAVVTAVELDDRLVAVLHETLAGYDNVRIIHGNILKLDIAREISACPFKVVANLPYYITTPIIMHLLTHRLPLSRLVVMVQKEVARRMVATPGGKEYGALSVAVQYYTQPELVFTVLPQAFLPPPAVESAVVRCAVRQQPPVTVRDEAVFFRVVKAAFAQRRKTFANALKAAGLSAAASQTILARAGIDGQRRGETLSLAEFAAVAEAWCEIKP